jgi:hypothetical protein
MLGVLLHAPRGPFYSPKVARSRWTQSWKAILAFCRVVHRTVRCTTGHPLFMSGARFPSQSGAADRCSSGLDGAPDTVRCTSWPLEQSTCRPQISPPTIGAGDRWLTGQSGAPPDSPVNYSHVTFLHSRERRVRHGWLTGQSGEL